MRGVFTPILIAASIVLLLSFAIRASFGVFQIPIANDLGWFRTEFSLAIAIQNLAWGIATPLFGAFAGGALRPRVHQRRRPLCRLDMLHPPVILHPFPHIANHVVEP